MVLLRLPQNLNGALPTAQFLSIHVLLAPLYLPVISDDLSVRHTTQAAAAPLQCVRRGGHVEGGPLTAGAPLAGEIYVVAQLAPQRLRAGDRRGGGGEWLIQLGRECRVYCRRRLREGALPAPAGWLV